MIIRYIKKKYPNVKIVGFSRSDSHDQELLGIGLNEINRMDNDEMFAKMKDKHSRVLFLDCVGG